MAVICGCDGSVMGGGEGLGKGTGDGGWGCVRNRVVVMSGGDG